jgi:hypothetical protein
VKTAVIFNDLEKLREREKRLENQLATLNRCLARSMKRMADRALHLSECKKAIAQLTLTKMRTA